MRSPHPAWAPQGCTHDSCQACHPASRAHLSAGHSPPPPSGSTQRDPVPLPRYLRGLPPNGPGETGPVPALHVGRCLWEPLLRGFRGDRDAMSTLLVEAGLSLCELECPTTWGQRKNTPRTGPGTWRRPAARCGGRESQPHFCPSVSMTSRSSRFTGPADGVLLTGFVTSQTRDGSARHSAPLCWAVSAQAPRRGGTGDAGHGTESCQAGMEPWPEWVKTPETGIYVGRWPHSGPWGRARKHSQTLSDGTVGSQQGQGCVCE